jgi:redox-sensitive bicupin YhaK (pirin superfamily)
MIHCDSLGNEQRLRPHQLNLMTAGRGITHIETVEREKGGQSLSVIGAQLWLALPEASMTIPPAFNHYSDLPLLATHAYTGVLILGSHLDSTSTARLDRPALALDLTAQGKVGELVLNGSFEYGLLPFDSTFTVDGTVITPGHMAYLPPGSTARAIHGGHGARALLIGGPPMNHPLVMWWNYVGRSREEISAAHNDWTAGSRRFGDLGKRKDRITSPKPPWH